jgi:hypothetical protein
MTQIFFIFILIICLIFSIYNAGFEKKHDGKSILQEKKVKETVKKVTFVDELYRIFTDVSILTA